MVLKRSLVLALCSGLVSLASVPLGSATGPVRIAVLQSEESAPYAAALDGLREQLERRADQVQLEVHNLGAAPGATRKLLDRIRSAEPALVVTLGTLATRETVAALPDVPVVAGLVLNAESLRGHPNATGVVLELPVELEIEWLRRFFPGKGVVGVLFDPATNQEKIRSASRLAKQQGFELMAREIHSPRELPDALKSLADRVDVLWGVTDPLVFSPETAKTILLFSYRNRIPLTGLSEAWVKAGALYALDRDYADIGRQCAELAVRILDGTPPSRLAPAAPRTVSYSLNLKAANHMKLELPRDLVQGARYTYE